MAPSLGFNLTSWDPAPNSQPRYWIEALHAIFATGVRHVTIVPYWFFDPDTLQVSEISKYHLERGPTVDAITAAMRTARQMGMNVSLNPLIEIDANTELANIWRGSIRIPTDGLDKFFKSYSDFIYKMGEIAGECDANRFYIGSELAGLTQDPLTLFYWNQIADSMRRRFPGGNRRLSYAANYDEYDKVMFWDHLDEIGIDAYFELASLAETESPTGPDTETLIQHWRNKLRELRKFSQHWSRGVILSEFGLTPYRYAAHAPWDWHPTDKEREEYDPLVQARAVEALLIVLESERDWLEGVDFWHWQLPGSTGSLYSINRESATAKVIERYANRM